MLVIGSVVLDMCGISRKPKDLDLIATPEELEGIVKLHRPTRVEIPDENHLVLFGCAAKPLLLPAGGIVEIELAWPGSTAEEILNQADSFSCLYEFASLNTLYWLKMSHRFKKNTPHFEKTRRDILDMRNLTQFNNAPNWYKRRLEEILNYNHPKLNAGQTKENFFAGDGVRYYFNHDWVHTIVSRICGDDSATPAYTKYQAEGEAVKCDRQKFDLLPYSERLRGVVEEAMVLALERSQIPAKLDKSFNKNIPPSWSYKYALQKVCTSITSGWFREAAWENYDAAMDAYPRNYVERFWSMVEDSGVQPSTGQSILQMGSMEKKDV